MGVGTRCDGSNPSGLNRGLSGSNRIGGIYSSSGACIERNA